MKFKTFIGIIFILSGMFGMFHFFNGITGFVVNSNSSIQGINIFWIFLTIAGLFLIYSTAVVEQVKTKKLELRIYDSFKGQDPSRRNPDRDYQIDDAKAELGPHMTLGTFKVELEKLRRVQGGNELVEIVRESYSPQLKELYSNGDEVQKRVAHAFLDALGEKVEDDGEKESAIKLSAEERQKIKNSFKQFDGYFTSQQKEIVRKYGLVYQAHGEVNRDGHGRLTNLETKDYIPVAINQTSPRAGRNFASEVIGLIERRPGHYKK